MENSEKLGEFLRDKIDQASFGLRLNDRKMKDALVRKIPLDSLYREKQELTVEKKVLLALFKELETQGLVR